MSEYVIKVVVHKASGNSFTDNIIVKASCYEDALVEAEHKALEITNGQQRVVSLNKGYKLEVGGGCRW